MLLTILMLACSEKVDETGEHPQDTDTSEDSENTLSFESDILPLFKASNCDNCHGDMITTYDTIISTMAGDFDDGANACVLMPWITPFEPEQSYLQHKIDGTFINFGPEYGDTMHLFPGEEEIVRQWILDGALP